MKTQKWRLYFLKSLDQSPTMHNSAWCHRVRVTPTSCNDPNISNKCLQCRINLASVSCQFKACAKVYMCCFLFNVQCQDNNMSWKLSLCGDSAFTLKAQTRAAADSCHSGLPRRWALRNSANTRLIASKQCSLAAVRSFVKYSPDICRGGCFIHSWFDLDNSKDI